MGSPTLSNPLPSARYPGPSGAFSPSTAPPDPYRIVTPDRTAPYERPPSLEDLRPKADERPAGNPFATEFGGPLPRPSLRTRKPNRVTVDVGAESSVASSSNTSSYSGFRSPSDIRRSRNDSANDVRTSYADSLRADEELARRLQEEETRQAGIEMERINASNRRRRDSFALAEDEGRRARLDEAERRDRRNRLSREAEEAARQRAAEAQRSREASRERRDRVLKQTQDALEGRSNADSREKELNRRAEADLNQMAQERENTAALQRDSIERYQRERSGPPTTRTTYTYASGSPTISARSPTGSSRQPPNVVHNYSSTRRNSTLLERGDAVIERERRRVAGELADGMAGVSLEPAYDEDPVMDADARYSASQRARRERRERQRREQQQQRRLEDQGFF